MCKKFTEYLDVPKIQVDLSVKLTFWVKTFNFKTESFKFLVLCNIF
jgi:hypothetical protein